MFVKFQSRLISLALVKLLTRHLWVGRENRKDVVVVFGYHYHGCCSSVCEPLLPYDPVLVLLLPSPPTVLVHISTMHGAQGAPILPGSASVLFLVLNSIQGIPPLNRFPFNIWLDRGKCR